MPKFFMFYFLAFLNFAKILTKKFFKDDFRNVQPEWTSQRIYP